MSDVLLLRSSAVSFMCPLAQVVLPPVLVRVVFLCRSRWGLSCLRNRGRPEEDLDARVGKVDTRGNFGPQS